MLTAQIERGKTSIHAAGANRLLVLNVCKDSYTAGTKLTTPVRGSVSTRHDCAPPLQTTLKMTQHVPPTIWTPIMRFTTCEMSAPQHIQEELRLIDTLKLKLIEVSPRSGEN